MNTYEKIIILIVGSVIIAISIFSYIEVRESPYQEQTTNEISDFDKSFGATFAIGDFATIVSTSTSKEIEENCEPQKPVIVSVLHNIQEKFETHKDIFFDTNDTFQVDTQTLQLFCHKTATITLTNKDGEQLIITKEPFVREVLPGGTREDGGMRIKIDATIIRSGEKTSKHSTVSSEMLIPDRLLGIVQSSPTSTKESIK